MKTRTDVFLPAGLLLLLLSAGNLAVAKAGTLDQTGAGRFGAGHQITANTASQNLLTWNVVNTGRDIDLRLYDRDGNPLSLGRCGLPTEPNREVRNDIRNIGWTQLTSRYVTSDASLDVYESLLTPVLWFRTNSPTLALFQPEKESKVEALALPLRGGVTRFDRRRGYDQARDGRLARPWFLALVRQGDYRFPVICLLHHAPQSVQTLSSGGMAVRWRAGRSDNTLGLMPLFGCRPATLNLTAGWEKRLPATTERRIDTLAAWFLHMPAGLRETYRLTRGAVQIVDTLRFSDRADDWRWSRRLRGYALVPPALVNARHYGYPVTFRRPTTDLSYPLFLSPLEVVRNTRVLVYSLPLPQLYRTLYSPFVDPVLKNVLPQAVSSTVRDYSDYVLHTYRDKADVADDRSAIGVARSLASEYPCSRLMTPTARKTFDRWADKAAKRLYNRQLCYGYGKEAANGRRFLLDNYRIGGKDYIDAGWFGYDILAMWTRAHYAGRWDEVRRNWPWIRELFYGWNWTYSDYAVMYAPLYVDAEKGGNPKGYTDNMAMLPAAYAWARMADRLGDQRMRRDALYMLARERVGRFSRMTDYAYTRSCGFRTDVNYLPSDIWDGPNIAPSGRFVPSEALRRQAGAVVNYGDDTAGLWFLTGSFLEPVSPETMDLILTGDMKRHVADSERLFDRRFPRWYACPAAGEPADYQLYLRGVLFHEDPQTLRYYFDYQDGFRQGVWTADAWHADAFAGILLSDFHGLEYRDDIEVRRRVGNAWQPVKAEAEWNLLFAGAGRRYLTFWNATSATMEVEVRFRRDGNGLLNGDSARDMKRNQRIPMKDGALRVTLAPGSNVFAFPSPPAASQGIEARNPAALVVVNGAKQAVPITLINHSRLARRCRIQARGFEFAGGNVQEVKLPPGRATVLRGVYIAPNNFRTPPAIGYTLETGGRKQETQIKVLLLPAVTALLDVQGSKVVRAPVIGTAHVAVRNRRMQPMTFRLAWSLNGNAAGEKTLTLPADAGTDWNVPLRTQDTPPGRYVLSVAVQGPESTRQEQSYDVVILPARKGTPADSTPIVLYGFERGTEGWNMPDWPDANKDEKGKTFQPACSDAQAREGRQSLTATFRIAAGKASQGFVGVHPDSDWTPLRRILVDVYLPPTAPDGLAAQFYMMGDGWKWRQAARETALKPGQWTTVEIAPAGPEAAADWGCSEKDLQAGLTNVLDFGLRVHNEAPAWVGYRGPVFIDNFRAVAY